ncbi:unnamed protein product [Allacma fusca]|uniref:Uncharacterized protein n=1 Tax=Allacma fusca TaxID=39272 RepID=A0A8J2K904_9HEXA|nr:unnamed protein product [Allacma fusca]
MLSGCQDACEFHHYVQHVAKNGTKPPLLAATKVESFLSYNLSTPSSSAGKKRRRFQLSLQWPMSEDPSVVYSIVQHVRLKNIRLGWTWRLLEQTTMTKISLTFSEKPKIGDIRVLAATSLNLVHVFSQEKVVMKLNVPPSRTTPAERPGLVRIPNEQQPPDLWHLRKVSMVHQKFLVVTEITWDLPENKSLAGTSPPPPPTSRSSSISPNMTPLHSPPPKEMDVGNAEATSKSGSSPPPEPGNNNNNNKSKHRHNFLLTWEVSGGILKGNMVTDANTVTISLWPDTIYSIQVGLIEEQMNVEAERLNPWEYEVEPKVTIKSSLLSVNTSDAVYLTPEVERTESDVKSDLNSVERVSSSRVSVKSSISSSSSSSSSSTSSDAESISSLAAQIPLTAAEVAHTSVEGVNDNDHIRNSTTLTSLRCELASGASKWLCQLSISWLVILCSIYGLLFIFSMTVYLFFAFKHYPYCSHRRLLCCSCFYSNTPTADYYLNSRSTCKLALLPHDFHQQQRQHDFPHVQHYSEPELPQQKKDLDILSQYNIV